MHPGALTSHLDVAQVVFTTFVLFFIGLVIYLQRESNREGFPLRNEQNEIIGSQGLCGVPSPKTFILPRGETVQAPRAEPDEILGDHIAPDFAGAGLEPVGNKLLSNLGPAAYANRRDVPDAQFFDGSPRIVPLRADASFSVATEEPDPRGYTVVGADGAAGGVVADIWVDRSESVARYFEVATLNGRRVLLPLPVSVVHHDTQKIEVALINGSQFADVPGTKSPEQVTLREEDQISAYYGGGLLYASAERAEPVL